MSADLRPGYKQTEVGVIPEAWEVKPLGSVGHWFSGGTPSMTNDLYWNGEIPWVSAKDMKVSRLLDSLLHVTERAIGNGTRIAQTGAVLIVVRGMILAHTFPVAVATRPVAFNQDMKALVTRAGIDSEFILVWLQANAQSVLGIASESTHGTKRLASNDLFSLKVGLPPLPEQHAIAEALSDVDALLGALDRLIAKKRDIKQGAMQQLLTGQTRLPGFHGEWEAVRAAGVGQFQGGSGFPIKYQGATSGDYPLFKVSDMNNPGNETFMETARNYISEAVRKQIGATVFPAESIAFAKVGAAVFLERKKILRREGCLDNNMAAFVMDASRVHFRFIHYFMLNMKLGNLVSTTALPSLSGGVLASIELHLPSFPEQTAIAEVLADMDAELAALDQRRDKTRALKQGMMQELLTGKTRLV